MTAVGSHHGAGARAALHRVRAVSFDLGGTVVQLPRGRPTTALVADVLGLPMPEARAWMESGPKLRRLSAAHLAAKLAIEFNRPDTRRLLRDVLEAARRAAGAPALFDDAVPVLAELRRRGYLVVALSNAVGSSAPDRDPVYYRCFDAVLPSYDTGVCKPDRQAFATVEQSVGLQPDQLVHVGDSVRVDVHGALDAGWHGVHLDRSRTPHTHAGARGHVDAPCISGLSAILGLLPAAPGGVAPTAGRSSCD